MRRATSVTLLALLACSHDVARLRELRAGLDAGGAHDTGGGHDARTDAGSEPLSCPELVRCVSACEDDRACSGRCIADGSPTGINRANAVFVCSGARCSRDCGMGGDQDACGGCTLTECRSQLNACYLDDGVDLSCLELLLCNLPCSPDERRCSNDCADHSDRQGRNLIEALVMCQGEECAEPCGNGGEGCYPCLGDRCPIPLNACIAGEPPR